MQKLSLARKDSVIMDRFEAAVHKAFYSNRNHSVPDSKLCRDFLHGATVPPLRSSASLVFVNPFEELRVNNSGQQQHPVAVSCM